MNIIVGLGNPGEKYKNTKHNVGFIILDDKINALGLKWKNSKKFQAEICQDQETIYLKPQTYMNNSGQAVAAVLSYYKLLPKKLGIFKKKDCDLSENLTVIHDDIDIDFGKYKIGSDSSSAGHNGVKSIIEHLQTQKFKRIRIGIKNELLKNPLPTEKFVMQKFSTEEIKKIIGYRLL
jgi:PTH1 family peptidyl-tRNA hydrolase